MLTHKLENGAELRQMSLRYAGELFKILQENHEHLSEWQTWAVKDYDLEKTKEFIKRKRNNLGEETELPCLIFNKGKLVGMISLFEIDNVNRNAGIGYWIAESSQGSGTITIACKAILKHGFEELNLNRIVIRCATENIKSQAIPERLGFTKEGVSRQVQWLRDRFVGLVNYSLLKEEWENVSH